ncbi:chaperonin [Culex quinquefasciatus]|uniref:Chaperonin n=1 Tax=Culex quinquefasciatus TaxID=7176 RepID=B0WPN0_CULQU|nr:chaperonin [Culex quinquefasciatus]|eukprot:XP_001850664.1 chaperonin [Culex quinquefasciatus]
MSRCVKSGEHPQNHLGRPVHKTDNGELKWFRRGSPNAAASCFEVNFQHAQEDTGRQYAPGTLGTRLFRFEVPKPVVADLAAEISLVEMEPLVVKMSTARPNDSVSGSAQKLPKALAIGKPTKVKRAEKVVKSSLAGQQSAGRIISDSKLNCLFSHTQTRISSIGTSRDFSDDGMAEKTIRVKVMIGSRRGVTGFSKQQNHLKSILQLRALMPPFMYCGSEYADGRFGSPPTTGTIVECETTVSAGHGSNHPLTQSGGGGRGHREQTQPPRLSTCSSETSTGIPTITGGGVHRPRSSSRVTARAILSAVHSHPAKGKVQTAGQQPRREIDRSDRTDGDNEDLPREIMQRHIDSEEDDRFSIRARSRPARWAATPLDVLISGTSGLWIRSRSRIFLALGMAQEQQMAAKPVQRELRSNNRWVLWIDQVVGPEMKKKTNKKLRTHWLRAATLTGVSRSCRNSTWSHEEKGRNPTQDAYVLRGALLDCPLEYKKGESQINEIVGDQDFSKLLQEEHVAKVCADMVALLPEDVFTEMGVSDLAQQFLLNVGTAIRQLRKTGNNRLARAYGNHRQPNGETH